MEKLKKKAAGIAYQVSVLKNDVQPFYSGKIDTSKLTRKYLESKADALETYRNKYDGYFESLYEGSDDLMISMPIMSHFKLMFLKCR